MSRPANNDDRREHGVDETDELPDDPDIQDLLDVGYQQLDGFVEWLESRLKMDTRTAQQDCFNAESFVDYLANHQRKQATQVNEFDLRWFVFSHYIRKSIADRGTQERLPESLERFFDYLHERHGMDVPDWIPGTLEDRAFYLQRLRALQVLAGEDEADWKTGFRAWCEELEHDLDVRCLWLPGEMGEGMAWAERMGWREATLRDAANRLWQRERGELLADGLVTEEVRDRLAASYLIWLDTPQERLDGATPRETIRAERAEQPSPGDADDGVPDEF